MVAVYILHSVCKHFTIVMCIEEKHISTDIMHKFALKSHYTLFKNKMLVAFALHEKLRASQNIVRC